MSAIIFSLGKLKFSQLPYDINDKVHKTVIGGVDPTEYIVTDYWIDKDGMWMFKIQDLKHGSEQVDLVGMQNQ